MSLNKRFDNYIYKLNLKKVQCYFLSNKVESIIYEITANCYERILYF